MKVCSKNVRGAAFNTVLRILGGLLIAIGVFLVLIFVPAELWLVLLGAALIAVGVMLAF